MRTVIRAFVAILAVYILAVASLEITAYINSSSTGYGDHERGSAENQRIDRVENLLTNGALNAWTFAMPLLQLVVVLLVLEWFGERLGFRMKLQELGLTWNIQTLIAIVVIVSFCIAALGGIRGVSDLKDIALAVIGFYFGSRQAEQQAKELIALRGQLDAATFRTPVSNPDVPIAGGD
jgi:MFS family permease